MSSKASETKYGGTELPTFALATNWKRYVASIVRPYIMGDVLEVGAGLGAVAHALVNPDVRRWVAVEPDPALASMFPSKAIDPGGRIVPEVVVGTIESLPEDATFDAILYFDVLEHIEDDRREMQLAAKRLRAGGHLIVLAPAFPWLYSEFDTAVGHFRRYTVSSLAAAMPPELEKRLLRYADSVGVFLSATNRLLLHQSEPNAKQILFWDRVIIPISRIADVVFRAVLGRSAIGVFRLRSGTRR